MNLTEEMKVRKAARAISDVDIPDETWKSDFEIIDRYQNFANELMRIALIGIGGYGFVIYEISFKDSRFNAVLKETTYPIYVGVTFLLFVVVLILLYRFYSTTCLYCQVQIMRSLKRSENSHWNETEKEAETLFLKNLRQEQRVSSKASNSLLKFAAFCFASGFTFLIYVLFNFLQEFSRMLG